MSFLTPTNSRSTGFWDLPFTTTGGSSEHSTLEKGVINSTVWRREQGHAGEDLRNDRLPGLNPSGTDQLQTSQESSRRMAAGGTPPRKGKEEPSHRYPTRATSPDFAGQMLDPTSSTRDTKVVPQTDRLFPDLTEKPITEAKESSTETSVGNSPIKRSLYSDGSLLTETKDDNSPIKRSLHSDGSLHTETRDDNSPINGVYIQRVCIQKSEQLQRIWTQILL